MNQPPPLAHVEGVGRSYREVVHRAGLRRVPKVIPDRLGHTNVGFTLRVYTHVYDEQRRQAAVSFQELLNKEGDEQG